ncbi:MAG: group II intron maturase-specific domain-containing protein [Acidimicrobiales bacterium]
MVHCESEHQAREVWAALAKRMDSVGLRLHPDKTKIVYCKDAKRRGSFEQVSFTFLGYMFRPRKARQKDGRFYVGFLPGVSPAALKAMGQQVRNWRIHHRVGLDLRQLAEWINPIVSGWMTYYGRFYRSTLHPFLHRINTYLMRWAQKKYRRLRSFKRFQAWWSGLIDRESGLFVHWAWMRAF